VASFAYKLRRAGGIGARSPIGLFLRRVLTSYYLAPFPQLAQVAAAMQADLHAVVAAADSHAGGPGRSSLKQEERQWERTFAPLLPPAGLDRYLSRLALHITSTVRLAAL
jgi:hypothetical protein